jgi:uncharacterized protein YjbI with pentapeptide repeats
MKIYNRNGNVLFEKNILTLRELIELSVKQNADLTGADLRGADLREADLREADLREADLREADLAMSTLARADLREADLTRANLTRAYLRRANLRRANLREVDLRGADLTGVDLTGADLRGADLTGADLTGADLTGADLRADLTRADLTGADLTGAYLRRAYLRRANLREVDLRGADLRGADLTGADLTDVKGLVKIMNVKPGDIYWKRFNEGLLNMGYQFKVGLNELRPNEIFANDERVTCSYPGFHFADRKWCKNNYPNRPLEAKIRIPMDAKINEPWTTDGKASADKIEILQIFDVKTGEDITENFRRIYDEI